MTRECVTHGLMNVVRMRGQGARRTHVHRDGVPTEHFSGAALVRSSVHLSGSRALRKRWVRGVLGTALL